MHRKPSAKTASVGLAHTQLAVVSKLGWVFRDQPTEDYGIDAQIEVDADESVEGQLLALQVKGGTSWFSEPGLQGWWYRPDKDHVAYWLKHALPVAVVLYRPETELCHWQLVNRTTLQKTSKGGWKVLVPEAHILDESAIEPLRAAAEGEPYDLRIRELRLALPWMEMLASGRRLVVDIDEWINKTSGRGGITLGVDNEDGEDPQSLAEWGVILGGASYEDVVPRLFAWADVSLHEETYDDADHDEWESECVFYDEGDRFVRQTFSEWAESRHFEGLRPYANSAGEVDHWRLELTLNRLGLAFLEVDRFALTGDRQLTSSV